MIRSIVFAIALLGILSVHATVIDLPNSTTSFTVPSGLEAYVYDYNKFKRCQIWDGNNYRAKAPRLTENRMVREDRKWVSDVIVMSYRNYGDLKRHNAWWTQWFEGTREINGQLYHDLHFRYDVDRTSHEYIIACMREEDGRVYMRTPDDVDREWLENIYKRIFDLSYFWAYEEEALLYDFDLLPGDKFERFKAEESDNVSVLAADQYEVISCGHTHRAITYIEDGYSYLVIDGLGIPQYNWSLCFPFSGPGLDNEYRGIRGHYVYDGDGNMIFNIRDIKELGVEDVEEVYINISADRIVMPDCGSCARIEVYNTAGTQILSVDGEACAEVSLEALPAGIYIVRATDGNHVTVKKIGR